VYALLGPDHDSSPYTQTEERIARIAAGGIRLVVDELRSDVIGVAAGLDITFAAPIVPVLSRFGVRPVP
jgi:hypothetical protein